MNDLISRQAAIDAILALIEEPEDDFNEGVRLSAKVIYDLPTADVVEVVYCSQCKHSQYDGMFHKWYCNGRKIQADGYCHLAERREDE